MNVAPVHYSQTGQRASLTQPHILIADDDAFIRHFLTHTIARTRQCCTVSVAENGQQAWQLYQQEGADLIITDNNMPIMDGIALTKAIRQEQSALPIIMVSGSPDIQQQACAAGASIFLQKPLELQCLLVSIAQLLPTNARA